MKKLIFAFTIAALCIFFKASADAATVFPVSQLGNCRDYQECHLYCSVPQNQAACWSYKVYVQHGQVLADESGEDKVKALGISFPVAELGDCANIAQCKAYCEDSANKDACQAFAKKVGLTKQSSLIEKAKSELGCSTLEECKTFCATETNKEACETFAKKYNLKSATPKQPLLEAAKTELGCDSQESCKAICAQVENREKCAAIGKRFGMKDSHRETLVETAKKELGCDSFESCKAFCQDSTNAEKCKNFGAAVKSKLPEVIKEQLKKVGSCKSDEECRKVCAESPGKCPGFPGGSPKLVPFEGSGSGQLRPSNIQKGPQGGIQGKEPGGFRPAGGTNTKPLKTETGAPPQPEGALEISQ